MEKDSIVKTLLTSTSPLNLASKILPPSTCIPPPRTLSTVHYVMPAVHPRPRPVENSVPKVHNAYNQFSSSTEKDSEIIAMDHCYSRPSNWTPDSTFFQPTKTLFMAPPSLNRRKSTNPLAPSASSRSDVIDIIDVESVLLETPECYDKTKALHLMDECDRHATFARSNQNDSDWEDSVSKLNWTESQNVVFNKMVKIFNSIRLARLAYTDAYHEPILRRLLIDKSVKRVRKLFASVSWESRLTQWLHQVLIDHLSTSHLAAYLDILQTLKAKLPTFVDKMMFGPNSNNRVGVTSNESLFHLLKRPWDPFSSQATHNRPRKLPGNPVLIIVPSAPSISNSNQFKRQNKWTNLLSSLSTVVVVHTNIGNTANRLTLMNCADQMLASTRAKVQEVKADYPARPIILVGFNTGAAMALQVAQVEHVVCVICLGFSLLTAEGKRGEPDDALLELPCPALFVIGQCSNTSLPEDLEDLRERMRLENGLIVVGAADDYLRVSKKKKRAEGITQSAVDRIIVENVGEFISGVLLSPYPPMIRKSPTLAPTENVLVKRPKVERKRNNSNGSSIDSEPPSPTPKITRPVGRPPGSKAKSRLEAKWAAQVAQGIPSPSNSPPPPLTPFTNDIPAPSLLPPPPQPPDTSLVDKSTPKIAPNFDLIKSSNDKVPATVALPDSPKSTNQNNKNPPAPPAAKMQAVFGLNRSVLTSGNTLSNLLQAGCRPSVNVTLSQNPKQIKVLENLTLNTSSTAKLISSTTGRSIDLSKITVLNSVNAAKALGPVGNMVVMSDGKIKTMGTIKGTGSTPLLLPMSGKNKLSNVTSTSGSASHRVAKYITSKKQLIGRKPPHLAQKQSIVPSYSSNLPPPTNLTSQDIMDLPIIFADDNQMLTDNSKLQQSDIIPPVQPLKPPLSNPVGKFVFINKQMPMQSASSNSVATLKRPSLSVPVRTNTNPVKYTKIIISRASSNESKTAAANTLSQIGNISSEISIRKIEPHPPPPALELLDLENAIVANTIPNPRVRQEQDAKNIAQLEKSPLLHAELGKKRTVGEADLNKSPDNDPDYIPSKNAK